MTKRIVVTGMGTVNPLGYSVEESWQNALNGVSGVGPITIFDASDLLVRIACEVKDFDPTNFMERRQARRVDRFQQLAIAAFEEAVADANLEFESIDRDRVAIVISSAVGGLTAIQDAVLTMVESSPRRISPFTIPMMMANGAAGWIAIDKGLRGPCFSVASACASAEDAIGQASLLLHSGVVDVAITGGSEATINRVGVNTFDRLGALSRRNDDYENTPAPFDRDRDGLVMGEGAALIILETLEHAEARGAKILAELAGYGSTVDAFHISAPAEDGSGAARAISLALQMAGVEPEEVDYINAHGTGTELNDVSETRAIKRAFGEHAYDVPVSSTKSMTGHMMGATGALESIFCIRAIDENVVPPTIHFRNPDPECDLDYVPNKARELPVEFAITNAFGFGGQNAVLAFKSFSG
jgi:beta-ketoacyl-acyl-carrier-protein synthase II